jgi:hypothetical protein
MAQAPLLMMGKARGQLLCESRVARVENFEEFRNDAIQLMSEAGISEPLPPNAVVFLLHQGYSFAYLVAEQTFDTPVYYFADGAQKPAQIANSFAGFLQSNVRQSEQLYEQFYSRGGYYLTIEGDSVTQTYPTLSSGDQPLEKPLF